MGRREEKKQETRERLRVAAYARFERHGYEATKVEDIARDAGVSPRTVYRYFPTKSELVYDGLPGNIQHLVELISDRPRSERPFTAIANALTEFAPGVDSELGVERGRIIAADATLYRYSLELRDQSAEAIGEALIERGGAGGTDEERRLLGHLAMSVLLVAGRQWRDAGPKRRALGHYVEGTLAAVPRLARMQR
jgi:AcrR family transcriptional regulator